VQKIVGPDKKNLYAAQGQTAIIGPAAWNNMQEKYNTGIYSDQF